MNINLVNLINFIIAVLALVYGIFMLIYLNDAQKCDKYLSKQDQTFRKVAYVVTWVDLVLLGLAIVISILNAMGLYSTDQSSVATV